MDDNTEIFVRLIQLEEEIGVINENMGQIVQAINMIMQKLVELGAIDAPPAHETGGYI